MENVKLNKAALITRVKVNRDNHRKLFEQAQVGFREEVIKELDRHLDAARSNKTLPSLIRFDPPQDHTNEYDRILDMLDMSVEDVVELDSVAFAHFVRDEWQWKQEFLSNVSKYSK